MPLKFLALGALVTLFLLALLVGLSGCPRPQAVYFQDAQGRCWRALDRSYSRSPVRLRPAPAANCLKTEQ